MTDQDASDILLGIAIGIAIAGVFTLGFLIYLWAR
jgi:hypothetical protein